MTFYSDMIVHGLYPPECAAHASASAYFLVKDWHSQGMCCSQVRELEAERVEAICTPSAAIMAASIRDMLNGSGRINARKGGAGPVALILEVPVVCSTVESSCATPLLL